MSDEDIRERLMIEVSRCTSRAVAGSAVRGDDLSRIGALLEEAVETIDLLREDYEHEHTRATTRGVELLRLRRERERDEARAKIDRLRERISRDDTMIIERKEWTALRAEVETYRGLLLRWWGAHPDLYWRGEGSGAHVTALAMSTRAALDGEGKSDD